MSEGSVPPFRRIGLGFRPVTLVRKVLRFGLGRIRPGESESRGAAEKPGYSDSRERAASVIQKHTATHATLFERLERLRARARRLEQEGTPSDSANNRADRAEGEVRSSLMDLRSSFAASGGDVGAFDLELKRGYPGFEVPENP